MAGLMQEEEEEKVTWVGWVQTCVFWHQTDLGSQPSSAVSVHILNSCTLSSWVRWLWAGLRSGQETQGAVYDGEDAEREASTWPPESGRFLCACPSANHFA